MMLGDLPGRLAWVALGITAEPTRRPADGHLIRRLSARLLTLIVSLEAIFLSTFVMIGQNRQAEFQRAKADHDFATEAQELRTNTELTRAVHTLTTEFHRHVLGSASEREPLGERPDE